MEAKGKIVVNIINRNYPPGPGITGESANELAQYLMLNNVHVNVVHINALYSGSANALPYGNIFTIKTFYNGKNKLLRLLANLYEGYKLIQKSKSFKPDITICLTDPPLLNWWASILLKKCVWFLWTMDIYPEVFAASKLITKKNVFYQLIDKEIKKNQPNHFISLGPSQSAFLKKKYGNNISVSEVPCGIIDKDENKFSDQIPFWASDKTKIILGYCGNLGEAHSLSFLYKIVDTLDSEKFILVLSVYGSKAKDLIAYVNGKRGIIILPAVKKSDLKFIEIHLASLKEEWANICVPSKTVSSVSSGSSFIYNGLSISDNWQLLNKAGWLVDTRTNTSESINQLLKSLTKKDIIEKKIKAAELSNYLKTLKANAFKDIYQRILYTTYNKKK